jgi:prepilin-type N-terminal cleavage/methylation domain-containing protein
MNQGFSLTEVLVSLVLMTGTSLALLQHQWQVSQLYNHTHTRGSALLLLDNASERFQFNGDNTHAEPPFNLSYSKSHGLLHKAGLQVITVKVSWPSTESKPILKRQLLVGLNDA